MPAQLPFVLFLVEEYLGEFLQSEPLAARMVAAALARLAEVRIVPSLSYPPALTPSRDSSHLSPRRPVSNSLS